MFIALVLALFSQQQTTIPAEIVSYLERAEMERRALVRVLEIEIKKLEPKLRSRKTIVEAKRRKSELESELLKLQAKPYYTTLTRPLSKGKIGKVSSFKVFQIADADSMLCKLGDELIWVTGISTLNLSDGDSLRVSRDGLLQIVGNKQYSTVLGGSKTVMHAQFHDLEDVRKQAVAIQTNLVEK